MDDIIDANYANPETELEVLFSEMSEGYKVQVTRKEPFWCDGHLGTFEWSRDEPISMDWLRKNFGGRKLQVKIIAPNNQYRGSRTVKFPDPPREYGREIIQGPDGDPISPSMQRQLQTASREPSSPEPQHNDMFFSMMKSFIESQNAQSNAMQAMLLQRVNSLETLLAQKLTEQRPPAPPTYPGYNPHDQLRQTLETLKLMEELKSAVATEGAEEPQLYEKMLGTLLEKFMDKEAAPKQQEAAPVPPLPSPQVPRLAGGSSESGADEAVVDQIKLYLSSLGADKKAKLLQDVLGDEFIFEEDPDDGTDITKNYANDASKVTSVPYDRHAENKTLSSLLSDEDNEILADDERSATYASKESDTTH